MIKSNCPLCNSKNTFLQQNDFTGYKVDMKFQIHICENCETSYPFPMLNADKLYDFIYKNQHRIPGYSRYWYYFKEIKKQRNPLSFLADSGEAYFGIREALLKIKKTKENLKVLDVGCGLGYLTYALKSEQYDVYGIDISKEAINNAKKHFGNYFISQDIFEYAKNNKNSFDVIILTELIEHLENPIDFLKTSLNLLNKNGKIIITTPNRSIANSDIVWLTESPPIHHWWYSEKSIAYMAKKLNLKLEFVSFKKFYARKPKIYNIRRYKKRRFRSPTINENWELYKEKIPRKKGNLEMQLKKISYNFSFIVKFIFKVMKFFNPSIIICKERGKFICAILVKT